MRHQTPPFLSGVQGSCINRGNWKSCMWPFSIAKRHQPWRDILGSQGFPLPIPAPTILGMSWVLVSLGITSDLASPSLRILLLQLRSALPFLLKARDMFPQAGLNYLIHYPGFICYFQIASHVSMSNGKIHTDQAIHAMYYH